MSDSEKNSSKRVDSLTMIIGMIEEQNKFNKEIMKTMRTVQQEMTNEMKKMMEKQEEMKKEFDEKLEKVREEFDKLKVETNGKESSLEKNDIEAADNRIIEKKQDLWCQLSNQVASNESDEKSHQETEKSDEDDKNKSTNNVTDSAESMKKDIEELNKKQDSQNEKINDISKSVNDLKKKKKKSKNVFTLYVRTPTGAPVPYEIYRYATVLELKKKIEDNQGVPADQQRLLINGKHIKDDETIRYCTSDGSLLRLSLRLEE